MARRLTFPFVQPRRTSVLWVVVRSGLGRYNRKTGESPLQVRTGTVPDSSSRLCPHRRRRPSRECPDVDRKIPRLSFHRVGIGLSTKTKDPFRSDSVRVRPLWTGTDTNKPRGFDLQRKVVLRGLLQFTLFPLIPPGRRRPFSVDGYEMWFEVLWLGSVRYSGGGEGEREVEERRDMTGPTPYPIRENVQRRPTPTPRGERVELRTPSRKSLPYSRELRPDTPDLGDPGPRFQDRAPCPTSPFIRNFLF